MQPPARVSVFDRLTTLKWPEWYCIGSRSFIKLGAIRFPLENHFIQCQEKQKSFPSPPLPLGSPHWPYTEERKPLIEDNIEGKGGQGRQAKGRCLEEQYILCVILNSMWHYFSVEAESQSLLKYVWINRTTLAPKKEGRCWQWAMLKSRVESLKVELEERRAEVTAATGSAVCRLVGQSYISSSLRFIVPAVSLPYHDCYLPAVQFSTIWLYLVRRRIFFFLNGQLKVSQSLPSPGR